MENEYTFLPADETSIVDITQLALDKSKDFARAVSVSYNYDLIECRKITKGNGLLFGEGDEVIIYDTPVDIGQQPTCDIRYTERIAVQFTAKDDVTPYVYALRSTFPQVLHRISLFFEKPACLCIYELPYEDLKLDWRSERFLYDIRLWLTRTATGNLHENGQPLEPLILFNEGRLIIPADIKPGETLSVFCASEKNGKYNLIAATSHQSPLKIKLLFLTGNCQEHGIINKTPSDLKELNSFLKSAGVNLVNILRTELIKELGNPHSLQSHLVILVKLPKTNAGNEIIENDFYTFLTVNTIDEIGLRLDIWAKEPSGSVGGVLFPKKESSLSLDSLNISVLAPYVKLSKEVALFLSGSRNIEQAKTIKISQIGVGALGSQLFFNLARIGYGIWSLIDNDIFLPHNAVRHELHPRYIGKSKSQAIANEANTLFDEEELAKGIWENYLNPDNKELLEQAILDADVVLDTSTSIAVARELANRIDLKGRKISMFLNPAGTDLIIIAEDIKSKQKLDFLEFQYYRGLINNKKLSCHLINKGQAIRYSNSCRDLTSRISQDNISILSSIGSSILKKIVANDEALINVWSIESESMAVESINVPVEVSYQKQVNGWKIIIDRYLIDLLSEARLARLPVETGGILIGGYDFASKKIYVVDAILSPADSEEHVCSYVRGTEGVQEKLLMIENTTAGHLKYVGEWHSHPQDCSLNMSHDDIILFKEISDEMNAIGCPPLMIIAGDNNGLAVYT
jgi:molybdopterin/thiamine biosynthesis adenylyltransferase